MELDHLNAGVVLFAKDGVCNLLGEEGLADTGRALQNDVLLALQDALDVVEGLRVDEGLFGVFLEGIDGIVLTLRTEQNRLWGTFLDVFQQAIVLGRSQFEQGALVILENFALLHDVVLKQFGPGDLVAEFLQNLEDEFIFGSLGHFEESLDLLDRRSLVSDDEVAGLDGFEVFVLLTLVAVLIEGGIVLRLTNTDGVDRPNLGIGVEPVVFDAGLGRRQECHQSSR